MFRTTAEIEIPKRLIDQVIGQDKAVEIIKTAAKQRRHVLLIGPPGTGKSMLAQAMAELLPVEDLEDMLALPNPIMENEPIIETVPTYPSLSFLLQHPEFMKYYTKDELKKLTKAKTYQERMNILKIGLGRRIVIQENKTIEQKISFLPLIVLAVLFILLSPLSENLKLLLLVTVFGLGLLLIISESLGKKIERKVGPKLIVDNTGKERAPFVDATGAKAGALLGDVKHDPLQSGGLGTPAHLRVEAGAIHKAHKGVLFIDEIASLQPRWQQEILTAMQEKKYSITGQSETSSGALVKTQPAPCDFILVAAGNLEDLAKIHPALRSRIRGSGYEIYMETEMPDTEENRMKIARFVAQEVKKDRRIPHFTREAVEEIIKEARRLAERKGYLTLRLRELGGLVRAAGDLAMKEGAQLVEARHVIEAKKYYKSAEAQLAEKIIERKKEYQVILTEGKVIGRVNGLAVTGTKGLVLPILAQVTAPSSKVESKVYATGKLGKIAKEAVENVWAILKKAFGKEITNKDVHIQFLQTYEGVEGDSASISVAVAVISALFGIPVRQDIAMTGSLDVKGYVLPVGGVNAKIEGAREAGIKVVIIPKINEKDVIEAKDVEIIPVKTILDVLEIALIPSQKKANLIKKLKTALGVS